MIFVAKPTDPMPDVGDYLGQLKSELDSDDHIVEFVATGPKVYSYRTLKGKEICKIRGFSLNHENAQRLNHNTMKDEICRDLYAGRLFARREEKICKAINTKVQRIDNYKTLPYGY